MKVNEKFAILHSQGVGREYETLKYMYVVRSYIIIRGEWEASGTNVHFCKKGNCNVPLLLPVQGDTGSMVYNCV